MTRAQKILLILVVLAAAVLAACGTSSATEPSVATLADTPEETSTTEAEADDAESTTSTTFENDEQQLIAFAQCMREEGVDIDDPTVDADGNVQMPRPNGLGAGQGVPDGLIEARDACAEYLDGIELGFGGQDQTELQDTFLDFTTCMRDNGYDMPDIEFGAGGGGLAGGADEIDQDDPAWRAAFENCDDILAGFGPNAGAGRP